MAKKEKREKKENSLLFVTIVKSALEASSIGQHLGNVLAKNQKVSFVFWANQATISELQQTKTLQNHASQIQFCENYAALKEVLNQSSEQTINFTLAPNLANIAVAINEFSNQEIGQNHIERLIPEKGKKESKIPFANKVVTFTRQLFSGFQAVDENNEFLSISKDSLNKLESTSFFKRIDTTNFFRQTEKAASCNGFEITNNHAAFSQANTISIGLFKAIVNEKVEGFKNRTAFMVQESLQEIKRGEGFSNPNGGGYRITFFGISFLLFFLMPILSLGFGITWDEINIIVYAEDILNYFFSFGEIDNVLNTQGGADYNVLINYGLFFDSFAALVNKITPLDIYQTRHMLNALVGLMGIFFTGLLAREAGSWRTGLIGLLILTFSPYFFGHAMNNPKDIPFASGFVMSLYFIVRFLKQLPKPSTAVIFQLILSIAFVNSIRIGGLMLIGILGLFTGFAWLRDVNQEGFKVAIKRIPNYAKYVLVVTAASYFLAVLVWPYALQNPFSNPFEALKFFTNFSGVTIYEVFEGQRLYMNEVPWYYIPKFLLIGNPLFAVIGLFLALLPMLLPKKSKLQTPVIWFASFALVFPIGYAIYGESTLYNGWRHFIFVYPAMVVLAAAGWDFLIGLTNNKIIKLSVTAVLAALVINTAFWMLKYHPNEYTYYNELVGGYNGAYGNYELDTYGNGIRQGFEKLTELYPETKTTKTMVAINMTGWDWEHPSTEHFFGDSIRGTWTREYERFKKPWDYAIFFPRTYSPNELNIGAFPPNGTVYVEEIEGKPLYAIIKRENDFMVEGHNAFAKNRHTMAIQNFELALDYDSLNEEAWRNIGLSYLNNGEPAKAKKALETAIRINPNSHIAQSYLAVYYQRQNNLQKATELYKAAIGNKINYTFPYIQLGNIYLQSNMFTDALTYFEGGLQRLGRLDPQILNSMGTCYLQLRDYNNAVNYLNTAIQQDPNYADAYYNLGLTYSQLGDELNAQKYLQQAQQLRGR
jgi:tetratricopeptide (TPR) repeat protein